MKAKLLFLLGIAQAMCLTLGGQDLIGRLTVISQD